MPRNICDEANRAVASGIVDNMWEYIYGTEHEGNLPQYETYTHEGHSYAPCPYSTQSDEVRSRIMLNLSNSDPLPTRNLHQIGNREYFMKTDYSGKWGFRCTFVGCPFYIDNGYTYFHG
jgi:hypothetical protein